LTLPGGAAKHHLCLGASTRAQTRVEARNVTHPTMRHLRHRDTPPCGGGLYRSHHVSWAATPVQLNAPARHLLPGKGAGASAHTYAPALHRHSRCQSALEATQPHLTAPPARSTGHKCCPRNPRGRGNQRSHYGGADGSPADAAAARDAARPARRRGEHQAHPACVASPVHAHGSQTDSRGWGACWAAAQRLLAGARRYAPSLRLHKGDINAVEARPRRARTYTPPPPPPPPPPRRARRRRRVRMRRMDPIRRSDPRRPRDRGDPGASGRAALAARARAPGDISRSRAGSVDQSRARRRAASIDQDNIAVVSLLVGWAY
jgi:hypothetical protein